jgi:putative ABC transport system permease protein
LQAIRTQAPAVRWAAPAQTGRATVIIADQNWTTSITGTSPELFDICNWLIDKGSLFADSDLQSDAKVIVVGAASPTSLLDPESIPWARRCASAPCVGFCSERGSPRWGTDCDRP